MLINLIRLFLKISYSFNYYNKFLVSNLLDSFTATKSAPVATNDLTIVGPRPEYNFEKPFYSK